MHHVPVDAQSGSARDPSPNRLLAAPRLAGIVAAAGLLTDAVSAVFGPVMAASTSSRRVARGQWLEPASGLRLGQAGSLTQTEVPGDVRRGGCWR